MKKDEILSKIYREFNEKRFDNVIELLKRVENKNGYKEFVIKINGDINFFNGDFKNAYENYSKLRKIPWDVNLNLGLINLSEGKTEDAIKNFETILKQKINIKGSILYGAKYENKNKFLSEIYLYLGALYKTLGKKESAVKAFEYSLKFNELNEMAFANLGDIFLNDNNYDEAIKYFNKAISIVEDNIKKSFLYNDLGLSQLKKGLIQEAVESFKKAIILNPKNENAIYNLGIIYVRSGMEEKIKEDYKEFISQDAGIDIIYKLSRSIVDITQQNVLKDINIDFICNDISMSKVKETIVKAAKTDGTVFLYGENGTGKELVARAIHQLSARKDYPFIVVNCGALPETLLEAELFGYEKGAFTGAYKAKPGRFELADKGTLFLDEIGDISPAMQVKLLRVVEQKEFERIGGIETKKVDVRIITATNKDIKELVAKNLFREDLFYRLYVLPIYLPPLRERGTDILALANYFLRKSNEKHKKNFMKFTDEVIEIFFKYEWHGNVRQMENVIEQIIVLFDDYEVKKEYLPAEILKEVKLSNSFLKIKKEENEKQEILSILAKVKYSKTKAAKMLGISRVALWKKLKKLNIS